MILVLLLCEVCVVYVNSVNSVNPPDSHQSLLNSPLVIAELEDPIYNCKSKSTGLDGMNYSCIRNYPKICISHILAINNTIWDSNIFPNFWKLRYVIPIYSSLTKINSKQKGTVLFVYFPPVYRSISFYLSP